MFLYRLNSEQRESFYRLAKEFIHADDRLHPEEERVFELMRREMELDESDVEPSPSSELDKQELVEVFDDRESRMTVVLELFGLGYADDDFAAEESEFIREISAAFDVSSHMLKKIENWVLRQTALMQDAESMLRDE